MVCPELSVTHVSYETINFANPKTACFTGFGTIKIVKTILDKLEAIKAKFEDLGVALTNPEIVGNNRKFSAMSKEYRSLEKIVKAYEEYKRVLGDLEMYREALNGEDAELRELAKEELPPLEDSKEKLEAHIRQLLIPKDPQDEKNAIL